jgi:hypothetical protein
MEHLIYLAVTGEKYFNQFDLFYKSFLKFNDIKCDLMLITTSKEAKIAKEKYPQLITIEENDINKLVLYNYCEFRYEIFNYIENDIIFNKYDKIFYSDADALFVSNISLIFNQINDCNIFYVTDGRPYTLEQLNYCLETATHISYQLCETINEGTKQFILKHNVLTVSSGHFGFMKNSEISKNIIEQVKVKLKNITKKTTDNAMLNTVIAITTCEKNDPNLVEGLKYISYAPFNHDNSALFHFVHPAKEKGLPQDKLEAMKIILEKKQINY